MSPPAALDALRDCLRVLLDPAAGPWVLPVPAADFLAAAERHRCAGFLHARAGRLDPRLTAPLARLHDGARVPHLLQAVEMHRAVDLLAGVGVRALAVKGLALAAQTVGDPYGRAPGDVDLLVAPADVPAAHRALVAAGWVPPAAAPGPGPSWAWRHLLDASYELPFTSAVGELDLHWRLDPTVRAMPGFAALWAERVEVVVAGRPVATLHPAHALRYACVNAARDDWRWLRALVDVHLLCARDDVRAGPLPLRRAELDTLALTRAMVGLPSVPLPLAPVRPRVLACARRWQARPHPFPRLVRVPGAEWPTQLRRHLRGAGDADDVLRVLRGVVLLPLGLGAATAETAPRGVAQAVAARVRHAVTVTQDGRP